MKKIVFALALSFFWLSMGACSKTVKDTGNVDFSEISAFDLVTDMQCGWNLGNTFDATGAKTLEAETSWGQPETTQAMIKGLAESGIKTLRIPVSWHTHVSGKNLTIDPAWMQRVKTVVDWAIAEDMYVILNTHHDCLETSTSRDYGYYVDNSNYKKSEKYLTCVWQQICQAFNNGYSERLVFEIWNEPRPRGTDNEWWNDVNSSEYYDYAANVNSINEKILSVIRASGGNNKKRFVIITPLQASPASALADEFVMPEDLPEYAENPHLILSSHMYTPYNFAMGVPGDTKFTGLHQIELNSTFTQLEKKFSYNGYPVIIGEYGATNKDNLEDRVAWFKFYVSCAREHGFTCILWDNGDPRPSTTESERYGFYDRENASWYFPEILDAIVENCKGSL